MTRIQLDPAKLYGFRILGLTPSDARVAAKIGTKVGRKPIIRLGSKIGGKVGTKNNRPR